MLNTRVNPEMLDRYMQHFALGVFLIAINYGLGATSFFFTEPLADILEKAGAVIAVVGGILVIWVALSSYLSGQKYDLFNDDSFIMQAFYGACTKGFMIGWITLVFLEVLDKILNEQPPEFFIKTTLAVMLGAFSIKFFMLNRELGDDQDHVPETTN